MNTDQHIDDTTDGSDDTEGHLARSGRLHTAGEGDVIEEDTEGHMPRVRFTGAAGEGDVVGDDTEGHADRSGRAIKARGLEAADESDDTEGHLARSGRLHTAGEGDLVEDDAEGHRYVPKDERFGGSEPRAMRGKLEQADDTEGHGFRGNVEAADAHDTEGHGFRAP